MKRMFRLACGWLLAACLLALPVVYVIGPVDHWRAIDYVAAWLYAVLLLGVLAALAGRAALLADVERSLAQHAAWLGGVWRGQTRGAWLLAGALALGGAYGLVRAGVGVPPQPAVWVKLLLNAPLAAPPAVALRYGAADDATVPVQWQPYSQTIIALRPAPSTGAPPLRVLAIQTDQGALPLAQIMRDGAPVTGELTVTNPAGALLSWPQPTRAFTLTLAGRGAAEALWFDQRGTATLGGQPATLALRLPAAWQGWALLPPQFVARLAVDTPAGAALQRVEVWGDPPQSWDVAALPAAAPQRVELPGFRAFNQASVARAVLALVGLTLLLLGLFVALMLVVRRLAPALAARQAVETPFGAWLRDRTARWQLGWALLAVWLVALAWHTVYALNVPFDYTNDSFGYYAFGQQLLHTQQFARILIERPPGYPAFLALVMLGAGDSALTVVLLQHLALSLLAPLTVWALAGRVPLAGAALAGLSVALLPASSVVANVIHTEALYTTLATAALLLYVRWGERLRGLLGIGVLVGAATMLRPNGALLLAVLLGWVLLRGWCGVAGSASQRWALRGSVALVAGYLAVAAPWQLHLALVRGTLDLSDGRAQHTRWGVAASEHRIDATLAAQRPDRAVWTLWSDQAYQAYSDPYPLNARYPELIAGIGRMWLTKPDDALGNQAFYAESVREANAAYPERLRSNQIVALRFNLFFRGCRYETNTCWHEMTDWFIRNWHAPPPPPPAVAPDGSLGTLLPHMVYRPLPARSPLRDLLLFVSLHAFSAWFLLGAAGLLSVAPLLRFGVLRPLMPAWLCWITSVLAVSAIGMPVDRYIVVSEPLLCTLATVCIVLLATCRWRVRVAAHPAPKFGYNSASDAAD